MYIASARPLDDPSLTDYAGPLMTWHEHNNLCWGVGADGKPKVVGLTDANGNCARGVQAGGREPDGPRVDRRPPVRRVLRAGGRRRGQRRAVPQDQRTDTCAAAEAAPTPTPHRSTATDRGRRPSLPYDPTKPIDLSGVAGVTPEQQAAAENLVAINVVRLPQWADYRTAEAAGYHSIGDAGTGYEHFIKWDSINDDMVARPRPPGDPRLRRRSPTARSSSSSAMFMLPEHRSADRRARHRREADAVAHPRQPVLHRPIRWRRRSPA